MSDNRFQNCHTVAQALRRYRDMEIVDADDDFELTVRLYQLAPKVPRTVTAEQRERAVPVVMAAMREAQERGTDILSGNRWLDRIIDALGWTSAEPEADPDAGLKLKPGEVAPDWSKLLRRDLVVDDPAPAPPAPVVELDWHVDFAPDELLTLAKIVDDFERLYHDVAQVVAHDTMRTTLDLDIIDGDLPVRVVCNDHGCWVLRIGGDQ